MNYPDVNSFKEWGPPPPQGKETAKALGLVGWSRHGEGSAPLKLEAEGTEFAIISNNKILPIRYAVGKWSTASGSFHCVVFFEWSGTLTMDQAYVVRNRVTKLMGSMRGVVYTPEMSYEILVEKWDSVEMYRAGDLMKKTVGMSVRSAKYGLASTMSGAVVGCFPAGEEVTLANQWTLAACKVGRGRKKRRLQL